MKNFYTLPAGTCFKAKVLDIQPGKVTIRLDDGGHFTARSLVSPDARIGEESFFRVKVNNLDGLIQLEMIKGSLTERQDNILQEALADAGMSKVQENIEMGRALLDNNLPIDAETLQKAAFFNHLQDNANQPVSAMNNAIFLLQEGFPTDAASMRALESSCDPEKHLSKLLDGIQKAPRISLDLEGSNPLKPLNEYYRQLYNTLKELKDNPQTSQTTLQKLDMIEQNLSFMRQVSRQVRYYQIPFTYKDETGQGELFIYQNSGNNNNMVAIDTKNLGRIEVITSKDSKELTFKFCGDTDEILSLIQSKSGRLTRDLNRKGYKVQDISYEKYKDKNQRTTVVTPAPEYQQPSLQHAKQPVKRYAFDMRV